MKYEVTIEGKTPYMQHRMDDQKLEEWEKQRGLIIERSDVNKDDYVRALFHSYQDKQGFYVPSEQLRQSFINAGSMVKGKVGNAKKSMKNVVAGMFQIDTEKIYLPEGDFVIDKRSAVNQNVKARIITVRPKWEKWKLSFVLLVDNPTLTDETVKQIIEYAGDYVGIGSYRPQKNGYFGRFQISQFKKMNGEK